MDYNYRLFKTERKNSLYKAIIQAISKEVPTEEDVVTFKEDILNFFTQKDNNFSQEEIYDYIVKKKELTFLTIPPESKKIYDLYFKFNTLDDKNIFPLFSKSFKKEIEPNALFFSAFNHKYLNMYITERIPEDFKSLKSLSFVKFINEKIGINYDIINDILGLNIILLDQNLNYYTSYVKDDNDDYVVLKIDNQRDYTNIYFTKGDQVLYILNKNKNKNLIEYLEDVTETKYKNIKEEKDIDYILKDIESSPYSIQDFINKTGLMYKDNKN